jgi:cyclic beta-1,2-glucan synthetase
VEWLLDNGYVIQNAAEQVRENVPPGFYRKLPSLREGPGAGLTRVEDGRPAPGARGGRADRPRRDRGLLDAYQDVAPLAVGELWALPALLRLIVLEGSCPRPSRPWAPGPSDAPCRRPSSAGLGRRRGRPGGALAARAGGPRLEGLRRGGQPPRPHAAPRPVGRLPAHGLRQPRPLPARGRAAGARRSGLDELDVAAAALELADAAPAGTRAHHVGAYLIAEERARLEAAIGFTPSPYLRAGRALEPHAATIYLGDDRPGAAVILALPLLWLASIGTPGWAIAGAAAFALVPAWSLAAAVVDWLVTLVVPARRLPRMDAEESVPDDARTVVVTPVILGSVAEVEPLLATLEVNYLGNRDENLGFALLTDLADAPTQHRPEDDPIIAAMSDGIRRLNARYGRRATGPASTSCTASGAGTPSSGCGWAGSASAASSRSSTPSSPGAAPPPSATSSTCPTTCRACATSSPSTPTRGCRRAAPASWWPPSATRWSAPSSTRRATSSSPASPSCSPASRPTPRPRSRRTSPAR